MIAFQGCAGTKNQGENTHEVQFFEIEGEYEIHWEWHEITIDLADIGYYPEEKPIKTKKDAIAIGEAILEKYHVNGRKDFELISFAHLKQDNIWVFYYTVPDQMSKHMVCESLSVAIQGSDGKVIEAWVDEG